METGTKTVSSPLESRDIDNSKTFDHLAQCIHVQVRSILSFMQSLALIEEHNYIFLPYTLNCQSTVQNVATVFQSYNHAYQSLTCETAINTDFSELFSLKSIYVKYKNAILSLIDCFLRTLKD